ncbi:MAG: hypothetical protein H6Q68_3755 [Firmicutes bacterium]|nr:hypothetical protein [Bacillota bacterium]
MLNNQQPPLKTMSFKKSMFIQSTLLSLVIILIGVALFQPFGYLSLNCTIDDFATRFNHAAQHHKSSVLVENLTNDKVDTFGIVINERVGIKGVLNSDRSIRAAAIVIGGDGKTHVRLTAAPIACLISVFNPGYSNDQVIKILSDIEFWTFDKEKGEIVVDGVKYRFNSSEIKGAIVFYIYRPNDLLYSETGIFLSSLIATPR